MCVAGSVQTDEEGGVGEGGGGYVFARCVSLPCNLPFLRAARRRLRAETRAPRPPRARRVFAAMLSTTYFASQRVGSTPGRPKHTSSDPPWPARPGYAGGSQRTDGPPAAASDLEDAIGVFRGRLVKRKEAVGEEDGALQARRARPALTPPPAGVGVGTSPPAPGAPPTAHTRNAPAAELRHSRAHLPTARPPGFGFFPAAKHHPGRTYYYRQGNVEELLDACNRQVRRSAPNGRAGVCRAQRRA